MTQTRQELLETAIHWSLLILTLLYLISGLGITQYHIVETLTFGLLAKNLAFTIHENLLTPFIILLLAHILVNPAVRIWHRLRDRRKSNVTQSLIASSIRCTLCSQTPKSHFVTMPPYEARFGS